MKEDWLTVFPDQHMRDQLTNVHVSRLAGKNPLIHEHVKKVASCLGITQSAIQELGTAPAVVVGQLSSEDPAKFKGGETEQIAKDTEAHDYKRFKIPMSGLKMSFRERVETFQRWIKLGRVLLSFQLITAKGKLYAQLNTILAHVRKSLLYTY
jgi:hypothetical protein